MRLCARHQGGSLGILAFFLCAACNSVDTVSEQNERGHLCVCVCVCVCVDMLKRVCD